MWIFSRSINATRKMRFLLAFVALLYVASYAAGWYLVSVQSPVALEMRQGIHEAVLTQQPFVSVIDLLRRGKLFEAILVTFAVNLTVGAFLTTTLPGIVPLIGAFAVAAVTVFRGFSIGVTYPQVLGASPESFALGLGTLILELGAYVFSGAAGVNLALAPLLPWRWGVQSRRTAFKMAWVEAGRMFVFVAVLLILGAVWEMTGLFLLTAT